MNRHYLMPIVTISVLTLGSAIDAQDPTSRQTIERSFPAAPGSRVVVDAVNGSIRVHGYDGTEVTVVVQEAIWGSSASDLEQAREEIGLDIDADDGEINLFVDTPWRDRDGGWRKSGHRRDRHYDFSHQFEIRVPYGVALDLRTVNNGDVRVDDARGLVALRNVNGAVEASGILGITDVSTVNGSIALTFLEVPRHGGSVSTVNGHVDLTFPSVPDAHLRLETLNGRLFSAFVYTYRERAPHVEQRRADGMFVYRANGTTDITLGAGGPDWSLKTLNGDVHLRHGGRSE